MLTIIWWYEPN